MTNLSPLERTERLQRAVGVLERLVAACCLRPEGLKAVADYGVAAVEVEFTAANASDSKRIVGSGRMRAFNTLATIMSEGCGKEVRIAPIRWASDEEDAFQWVAPVKQWPVGSFTSLLQDAACAADIGAIGIKASNLCDDRQTNLKVIVEQVTPKARRFGESVAKIFFIAGSRYGHRLFADVVSVNSRRME